ncbi:MAG: DegT/DnrJ/EryC1/StrS family aminotransferase [Gaiellaceae bacterium]
MIPVFEPDIGAAEVEAVAEAVRRGEISGSFGESIPAFERAFADWCGVRHGVAVSSGTAALHAAVVAAGIGPGDEVVVSASTNIATALAVYHNGAVTVPVDSEPATWNLDLDILEGLITSRTKAIIPVHLFGHPVDMDRLNAIASRNGLTVIEDCAESHGALVRGRMTGSFGKMSCFSFYANKVITTGEGGMVLTDDDAVAVDLRLLRNLAFGTPRFFHEKPGYNFRMTGMQAAMGIAQMRRVDEIVEKKRRVADLYTSRLQDVAELQLPCEMEWARNVYWMYAVVIRHGAGIERKTVMERLRDDGVDTRTFFCPMGRQPFLRDQPGFRDVPCPVADGLWERGFYLPSSPLLDGETIDRICIALRKALRA